MSSFHDSDRTGQASDPADDDDVTPAEAVERAPDSAADATADPAIPAPVAETIDYKDRWLRSEAELQNFRRRVSRELEMTRRVAEESVALEMISALDDLERALEAARASGAGESWTQGVALVSQRMRDALGRLGIATVDPSGQPFDPMLHEAVLQVDAPPGIAPGTVVQVVDRGYRRGERALRAARVVVARIPVGSEA